MVRDEVIQRSGGACEAMVEVRAEIWTRCGRRPVEDHHLLTRARGGDLLDTVGETYHHLALCRQHHNAAHGAGGRGSGLLIDGLVSLDSATGELFYEGPDAYLRDKYGRSVPMRVLRDEIRGAVAEGTTRGEM